MSELSILPILQKIPIFKDLNQDDYEQIAKHTQMQYFPANYRIFSEGEQGQLLYVIKSGKVKISHLEDGQYKQRAILSAGDFFGEMALFSRESRNANAQTIEESEIFTLSHEDFLKLITSNQSIASKISSEFIRRVRENTKEDLTQ